MSKNNDTIWVIERTLPELNGQWVLCPGSPHGSREAARVEVAIAKDYGKASIRYRISKYTRSKSR